MPALSQIKNKILINYCIFATRSFPFSCGYRDLLDRVIKEADVFDKEFENTLFLNDFLKQFLDDDELPISKHFIKYNKSINIKQLYKSDFSLFLLKSDSFASNLLQDNILPVLKVKINLLLKEVEKQADLIAPLLNKSKDSVIQEIRDRIKTNNSDNYNTVSNNFCNFEKNISQLNESLLFFKYLDGNNVSTIKKILKETSLISELIEANATLTDKVKILALISRFGVINISFVTESYIEAGLPTYVYDSKNDNELIKEAIDKSATITGRINRLPKLFSYLNLNKFFGFENKYPIYDNPSAIVFPETIDLENKKISNKSSTQKAIFLRLSVDSKYLTVKDDSPMIFYDYLSYLVAFEHSYDRYTIWDYLNNENERKKLGTKLVDYLNKPTEHMFFDDSLFTLSVIDETVNINRINSYLKDADQIKIEKASHQIRIYSFWDFIYICNSITYGSSCLIANHLFAEFVRYELESTSFKPLLNLVYVKLARIASKLNAVLNYSSFSAKSDSNYIVNTVFECIGLKKIEKQLNNSTNNAWRSANLTNNQTYQRYGITLSFIGLFITIFSYGLISLVDTSQGSSSDFKELFIKLFTESPKILIILTVITVPIFVWFVIKLQSMSLFDLGRKILHH